MKSKLKESFRIFPFAPGISWKLKGGKYIVPEMSLPIWQEILKDKTVVVSAFGGLIESFLSFSILETINFISPRTSLLWSGNVIYEDLLKINGLASYYSSLTQETLLRFPTPIFLDRKDKVYFNCLNNYLKVYSYYGDLGYFDQRSIVKQICEKNLVPWSLEYLPKIRKLPLSNELNSWAQINKFNLNKPYVLIIPDRTIYTQHNQTGLDWSVSQVKAFGAMLAQSGISLIVLTEQPNKYLDIQLYTLSLKLENFFYLLLKAKAFLSQDIDFLLLAKINGIKLISKPFIKELKLSKVDKFLEKESIDLISKTILPLEAYNHLIGKI